MDASREDVTVSALSSLLAEKLCECEDFNLTEKEGLETVLKLFCSALGRALEVFGEQVFVQCDPRYCSKGFEKREFLTVGGPLAWRRGRYQTADGSLCLADTYLDSTVKSSNEITGYDGPGSMGGLTVNGYLGAIGGINASGWLGKYPVSLGKKLSNNAGFTIGLGWTYQKE